MKNKLFLTIVTGIFSISSALSQIGGYAGTVKPEIITDKPDFELFFKSTDLKNIAKVKSILITGLNIGIQQELVINLRSGGTKATINDAGVNLTFKLMNLDKMMVQSATDELYVYLEERMKAAGYEIKPYDQYAAIMEKFEAKKHEASNGVPMPEATTLAPGSYGPTFTWFSANNMPSYIIAMKSIKALTEIDKVVDNDASVTFGFTVNFLEYDYAARFGKVEVSHKPQQYFTGTQLMFGIYPAKMAHITQKDYGYSFGREFIKEIVEGKDQSVISNVTWKEFQVYIDNEKFKANLLELGKSYIDNMVAGLKL